MFDRRAQEPELIDLEGTPDRVFSESHHFMERVNRHLGGIGVVKWFFRARLAGWPPERPIRVLDLACGRCDIPIAIARWGRSLGRRFEFLCIDRSDFAAAATKRIAAAETDSLRFIQADALSFAPAEPVDFALASLFMHHLEDHQIVTLVRRLQPAVRGALLVNDLKRGAMNYLGCLLLRPLIGYEAWHDGSLSVRKGFRPGDFSRLLAGIRDVAVAERTHFFGRISAVVDYQARHPT